MARFDIYENVGKNKAAAPFLVDVQNDFIEALSTRVVIPLVPVNRIKATPSSDVFPIIQVNGIDHYSYTPQLMAAPAEKLKILAGSTTAEDRSKIQNSLDKVFGGY